MRYLRLVGWLLMALIMTSGSFAIRFTVDTIMKADEGLAHNPLFGKVLVIDGVFLSIGFLFLALWCIGQGIEGIRMMKGEAARTEVPISPRLLKLHVETELRTQQLWQH